MKITIDTREDSHEEIKKLIRMLSSLIGEEVKSNSPSNIFEDSSDDTAGNALANMFGDDNTPKDDDNSGYLNMFGDDKKEEPEEPEEKPQPTTIIEY